MTETPPADQQLRDAVIAAITEDGLRPQPERVGLVEAMLAVVRPELERLRVDNEQLRDRLANYGSPLRGSAPLPPPDAGAEKQRAMREQLETGITDLAWAVGKALCPAGTKCPAGILAVFWPTKRGRLPIHRDIYGHSCSGSGQKANPLKAAVTTAQES